MTTHEESLEEIGARIYNGQHGTPGIKSHENPMPEVIIGDGYKVVINRGGQPPVHNAYTGEKMDAANRPPAEPVTAESLDEIGARIARNHGLGDRGSHSYVNTDPYGLDTPHHTPHHPS